MCQQLWDSRLEDRSLTHIQVAASLLGCNIYPLISCSTTALPPTHPHIVHIASSLCVLLCFEPLLRAFQSIAAFERETVSWSSEGALRCGDWSPQNEAVATKNRPAMEGLCVYSAWVEGGYYGSYVIILLSLNQGTKYRLGVTLCFLWMKFGCRIRVFLETQKYFHISQFRYSSLSVWPYALKYLEGLEAQGGHWLI